MAWVSVGLLWTLFNSGVRSALLAVVGAFLNWRILVVVLVLTAYVTSVAFLLSLVALWDLGQLKNTLVWLGAVGIATLLRLPHVTEETHFFREWASDNLKITIAAEFVVTFFTFDLWVELLIQPIVFLVVAMLAFAPKEPRYDQTRNFLNGVMTMFGMALIVYAAYMLMTAFDDFATWSTFQDFCVPIMLSLSALPFFFLLHVFMTYERVFSRLNWAIPNAKLRREAKLGAILAFGPMAGSVERWNRYIGAHRPETADDLKRAFRDVKVARRHEHKPTEVAANRGWSPALARKFLATEGIEARDYHRLYDEWFASSPYFNLGDGALANSIAYYLKGDELVVSTLRLVLSLTEPADAETAERSFFDKAEVLLRSAIPGCELELGTAPFETMIDHWHVGLHREDGHGGVKGAYELVLTIEIPTEVSAPE